MSSILTCPDISSLRAALAVLRQTGARIGLVPTMGALHSGHLKLVERARREADAIVASIFVNPTQFAAGEDLAAYPRTLESDLEKLAAAGVDIAFVPSATVMYPAGFATAIVPSGPARQGLEDRFRPEHFQGVATVVTKLFLQTGADIATFGEKDFQQLRVVTQTAADLDIPIRVVAVETEREPDGLAMSSRNRYLDQDQRALAPLLYRTLCEASILIEEGHDVERALGSARMSLSDSGFVLDYLELRDALSLAPMAGRLLAPARLLAAARLGTTRLIDNVGVTRT